MIKKISLKLIISFVAVIAGVSYLIWLNLKGSEVVFCTQEAKLCSDGSYVGRTGPRCEFSACPKEELIVIQTPNAFEKIYPPVIIKGKARGIWFFEASFPVFVVDGNGKESAVMPAQAKTNWMTTDFVDFELTLNFQAPTTQKGHLIFKKDNPSGLPEHDNELKMPIVF